MKINKLLLSSVFCLLYIFGGCSVSHNNTLCESTTQKFETKELSTEAAIEQQYLVSKLKARTAWNINVKFLEATEKGFKIKICDNDNQGFYYNPYYFVLEYKDENGWNKLTNLQEKLVNEDIAVVFPDENNNYTDTNNIALFSLIPDFELKNGQYRITKVISGKEFSVEFEVKEKIDEQKNEILPTTQLHKNNNTSQADIAHTYPRDDLKERTSWNIDITFLEATQNGFKIKICDNDNQGFYYNPYYFALEYKDEIGWKKLTNLQESVINNDLAFVYPSKNEDYTDTNNIALFSLIPNFELKSGQYRLTKVISGKEFSVEFEIDNM